MSWVLQRLKMTTWWQGATVKLLRWEQCDSYYRIISKDFLYQCKADFVQDALAKKKSERNLVLVTHSSCMDAVNESLGFAEVD